MSQERYTYDIPQALSFAKSIKFTKEIFKTSRTLILNHLKFKIEPGTRHACQTNICNSQYNYIEVQVG